MEQGTQASKASAALRNKRPRRQAAGGILYCAISVGQTLSDGIGA